MKLKPLKITFESIEEFKARAKRALEAVAHRGKKSIRPKDVLVWASVEAYQQFMSDQKYAILAAIRKYNPSSVYQLAKILNRAQQNVARDCDLLEKHGFLKFAEATGNRKTKAPKLIFNYNAIMVCLPSVTYRVEFEAVA